MPQVTPFDQALGGIVENTAAVNLPTDQSDVEKSENQGILSKAVRGSTPNSRKPSFRRVLF